jgi:hypothetical protein
MVTGVVATLWALPSCAAVELLDVSGSVGYALRSLSGSSDLDTTSNQLRGVVNARSYIWQPWFATADASLRFTQDSTDFEGGGSSTDTSIVSGDLNLNALSQSRTPFSLVYSASDSRVDVVSLASPLTTLGDKEFQTRRLALKQSYFNEQGDRFQARYDRNKWSARDGDSYNDDLFGVEMDLRRPQHTLTAKTSYQEAERNVLDQRTETTVFNVDHFYHPGRALRVDSMASYYDTETRSDQPLNSTNQGGSATDLGQLSSFVFWRPIDSPLSVSGGVRVFDLSGSTTGNTTELSSVSATGGLYYQMTQNLRLDANVEVGTNDNGDDSVTASRQRMGALYQSDIREIFSHYSYQWHSSGSLQNQDTGEEAVQTVQLRLGHDAQRLWLTEGRGTFRLSLTQAVSGNQLSGDADGTTERLDHSGSLSWDKYDAVSTTMVQFTLADSHAFGDQEDNQQFANAQVLRTQNLTDTSALSGNLTVQSVRRDFNGLGDDDTVTATGQLNYQQTGLFAVPRLRFLSDLRLSRAATDEGVDRAEWENRLDYAIGLLDTSLSWRWIDLNGDEDFNIVYFQVNRRF